MTTESDVISEDELLTVYHRLRSEAGVDEWISLSDATESVNPVEGRRVRAALWDLELLGVVERFDGEVRITMDDVETVEDRVAGFTALDPGDRVGVGQVMSVMDLRPSVFESESGVCEVRRNLEQTA